MWVPVGMYSYRSLDHGGRLSVLRAYVVLDNLEHHSKFENMMCLPPLVHKKAAREGRITGTSTDTTSTVVTSHTPSGTGTLYSTSTAVPGILESFVLIFSHHPIDDGDCIIIQVPASMMRGS